MFGAWLPNVNKEEKMKRFLSVLLVLSMLSMALVGCSKKTDEEIMDEITETASESTVTLSMYLLSENEVSKEVEEQIEAAVNAITKVQFKAQIDLRFYTADKYYAALDAAFVAADEEYMSNTDVFEEESESATEEETIINENGIPELKYPEISDHQVDIFYMSGYNNYKMFLDYGYLTDLSAFTKELNAYIFPDFLTYTKRLNGMIDVIPTNHRVGEYTFLLINKEAMEETNYTKADFATVSDANCQDFLGMIDSDYRDKYVPFYSEGDILTAVPNIKYWGVNANGDLAENFSVLGATYNPSVPYGDAASIMKPSNILTNANLQGHISAVKGYEINGYYATKSEASQNKDFAVGYIVGGAEVFEQYGDKYEIIAVENPVFTTDDIYSDMFAVGLYTSSASRCMDVITYMNTNEEFKNLILYGVEGLHYELVESEFEDANGEPYMAVRRILDAKGQPLYLMDNNKTGNTFLAKALEGEDPSWIDCAKRQNRDAIVSLALGFSFDYGNYPDNTFRQQFEKVQALTKDFYAGLDACKTVTEVETFLKNFSSTVNKDKDISYMLSDEDPTGKGVNSAGEDAIIDTFQEFYRQWLTDIGVFKFEEK